MNSDTAQTCHPVYHSNLLFKPYSADMRPILSFLITTMLAGCAASSDVVEQQAIALTSAAPAYPMSARRHGIEGVAHVSYCVRADGKVENIAIEKSSGSAELDASAIDAVKRSKFQSAKTASGKSIDSCVTAPYRFTLERKVPQTYSQKIRNAIQPHIAPTEPIEGNPSVEIKITTQPDGKIIDIEVVKSSGNSVWDMAAQNAVSKAGSIPLDAENRVPPVIYINFRPMP